MSRYPEIPPEAVLKEDLLRTGIVFDDSALTDNLDGDVKPKSYFIFSFDQKPLAQLGEAAKRRPPEEIALTGGPYELRRTIVSVRVNPDSPYRVRLNEMGALRRLCGELDQAESLHRHALKLAILDESAWDEAHARAGVARCALAQGRRQDAAGQLHHALAIFERVGADQTSGAAEISAELAALC